MIWKSVQRMFTLIMSEVIFLCLVNLKSVKEVESEDEGSWRTTTNLVPLLIIACVFLVFGPLNWYVGSRLQRKNTHTMILKYRKEMIEVLLRG